MMILSPRSTLLSRPIRRSPMAQVISFGSRIQCSDTRRISSERLKVARPRPKSNTAIPTGKIGLLCLVSEKMQEKEMVC